MDNNLGSLLETVRLDVENATRHERGLEPVTPYEIFVLRAERLGTSQENMDRLWKQAKADLPEDADDGTIRDRAIQYYHEDEFKSRTEATRDDLPEGHGPAADEI